MNGEQEVAASFPLAGVNVACEFSRQPIDTTPAAQNVRGFDPLVERARGGSRPGLTKWIDELVNGVSVIQHLTVLVDPTTEALTADTDDPSGIPDPTTGPRNTWGRRVRQGGSGRQPNRNQSNPSTGTAYRQRAGIGYGNVSGTQSLAFPQVPLTNSLLVAIVGTDSPNIGVGVTVQSDATTLADYTQAGGYVRLIDGGSGREHTLSLWHRRIATGAVDEQTCRINLGAAAITKLVLLEYKNMRTDAPVTAAATVAAPTLLRSVGPVVAGSAREVVIGVFSSLLSNLLEPDTDFTGRVQTEAANAYTGSPLVNVIDRHVSGPASVTPSGVSNVSAAYIAIAAAFKRS